MKTLIGCLSLGFYMLASGPGRLLAQEGFTNRFDFAAVTPASGITDPTPPSTSPGLVFGSFGAVGYEGNPVLSGMFAWTGNELGGINRVNDFSQFTGELNPQRFFEITVAPAESWLLDLDTIGFGVLRSRTGIRSYSVRSSLDNFTSNLSGVVTLNTNKLGAAADGSFRWLYDEVEALRDVQGSLLRLGDEFDALGEPVTFRFYGWNAEDSAGTFCIDNVVFKGTVRGVPEPGAGWLLGAFLGGSFLVRNRKLRLTARQDAADAQLMG